METTETVSINTTKTPDLEFVAPGVFRLKIVFVNVYFIVNNGSWALIDAGLSGSSGKIIKTAEAQFGKNHDPEAIFLTHGHFDHVGAIKNLLPHWNVPVYAHPLETPYLSGKSNYPPADPTVGGGAMSLMSFLYPNDPINIASNLETYTTDTLPGFPDWKILHTPGHAPGHVSFFRENDGALIAGDAFVTVKQESAAAVFSQEKKLHGPPQYFTYDWFAAHESVKLLASLNPSIAATGHGIPMEGELFRLELQELANNFYSTAVPSHGRYVKNPAIADLNGIKVLPPVINEDNKPKLIGLASGVAVVIAGVFLFRYLRSRNKI